MPSPSRIENRAAIESLTTAFERLAERAGEQGWPLHLVADAAFRAGTTLAMAHQGVPHVADQCRHLSRDLERLTELLATRDGGETNPGEPDAGWRHDHCL
jgi:hypothetical protein